MDETRYEDLAAYMAALKRMYPDIRPYEEDDWEWMEEGLDLLDDGQYGMAELRFQELVLSQPNFMDGYEGLARVYLAVGRKREAVFLVEEALRLAREYLDRRDIAPADHETIVALHREIEAMPDQPEAEQQL
jgi:tetratricopeptide (TPR) repeat protein